MPIVSDNLYPSRLPPRIPLIPSFDSRSGSVAVDAKLVNGFMEKDQDGDWRVVKRPGLSIVGTDPTGPWTSLGLYYWDYLDAIYSVSSSGLLRKDYSSTVGSVDVSPPTLYDFNELLGTPRVLFLKNRTEAYTLTSAGTFAQVTDPDYPGASAPVCPGSAYLDGTLYVMTFDARIWGCDLNDATQWDPLNVIRAQIEPDGGVALAKQGSYVVAFKEWTTEFFYNAGAYNGTLTGSPLLPVQNAKLPMGLVSPRSVQSIDDALYFVGRNKTLGPGVYVIVAAKITKISTFAVDKLIAQYTPDYAWYFRILGHTFYSLRIPASPQPLTLVYDITTQVWQFFQEGATNLDVEFASAGVGNGINYLQGSNGAVLRTMLPNAVVDTNILTAQIPIELRAVTPLFDAGTRLRKVLSKLRIDADEYSAGTLQIRWSDDDYQTWSPWIAINLHEDLNQFVNLGSFRKRAFEYRHVSPTPFRMATSELDLLIGSV